MQDSFDDLKREMDSACESLRSFTLGRQGYTQQDGVAAIGRVMDLRERLRGFEAGQHGKEALQACASAKGQILAAKARLDLLRR